MCCVCVGLQCGIAFSFSFHLLLSWITLEQGKTTADAMGDVWRGLEVVEAASRVGSEMLVRIDVALRAHLRIDWCILTPIVST